MGFYLRKSISVGGVRFNLSKSGIGMSAGIRGFRIGSGPRGAYVHAGTNGFYYRQSLPTGSGRTANHGQAVRPTPSPVASGAQDLTEIDSGDVLQMTDTSAEALLSEINEKLRKPQFVGWGVVHGWWNCDLRRGWRCTDGCRCDERKNALELSNQPIMEGVAHDLHIR